MYFSNVVSQWAKQFVSVLAHLSLLSYCPELIKQRGQGYWQAQSSWPQRKGLLGCMPSLGTSLLPDLVAGRGLPILLWELTAMEWLAQNGFSSCSWMKEHMHASGFTQGGGDGVCQVPPLSSLRLDQVRRELVTSLALSPSLAGIPGPVHIIARCLLQESSGPVLPSAIDGPHVSTLLQQQHATG